MERAERQLTRLLFMGVMALMLMLAYVTYSNMQAYVTSVKKVSFLNSLMIELDDVMANMHDEETGIRGYLLSGDSTFLVPAHDALRRRSAEMNEVSRAVAGTEWEIPVLPYFSAIERASVTARLLVQGVDSTDALAYSTKRLHRAKADMDEVHARYALLTNALCDSRRDALEGWRSDRLASPVFIGAFSLLAVVATSLLFWRLTRALGRTERVRGELRNMVTDLDEEVRMRAGIQALLQKVLDTSPSGIMSFHSIRDANGEIVDLEWRTANRMARILTEREDLVGLRLLNEMPESRRNGAFDAFVNVVRTGKPHLSEYDYHFGGSDGRFTNHAVKLDDGVLVIFQDISEQRNLQRLSMEAERFQLIGKVTRTVAHEVRNPLTNIHLAMEELESGPVAQNEDVEPFFRIIGRNLHRIGDLVKHMLESTQQRELRSRPSSVEDLVQGAIRKVTDRLELKNMSVTVESMPEAFVVVDPELIVLAMTNIMVNAIEAMEPGKGELTLRGTAVRGKVLVDIKDNGKGMSEVVLERLFDPFFTDRPGGLGLGLTASQSILNGHGILLTVESEVGNGTTFTLHFPTELTH
jgi:signal transduction histidine kinase